MPVVPLALLWWLLSDGEPGSWLVGIPFVLAAAWAAIRIGPSDGGERASLQGVLAFVPLFLWESVVSGVEVARRVMRPRMRLAPGFVTYRTRLNSRPARLLFVNSVNLLPGTLAVEVEGDRLRIHALDCRVDFSADLQRLETAVGRICREET